MSELKVATLNLHGRHDRWLRRRQLIVSEILDSQPELLSLQEIYRPIGQASWLRNQVNVRLSGSPRQPYQLLQQPLRHLTRGWFEAIGVLTRLPVVSVDSVSLGYGGRVALRVNVELAWRDTLDFVAVHLHHVASDREARAEQVMHLSSWLRSRNPVPLQVVAGDFNEIPSGPAIMLMKQTFRSTFVEIYGREPLATFPTALSGTQDDLGKCLDYIFISSAVPRVVETHVFCRRPAAEDPTLYPSDHVGLLATLRLNQQTSQA